MKKRNLFKIAALTAVFALGSMFANAQTGSTTSPNLEAGAATGTPIKVIDNKGTVKYIQTNNGITSITSTSAGNETRTTFQLGGTLIDNTHINLNGKIFALDNLLWENGPAAADETTGTGYTLLVRDEATGATKKMLLTSLISSGYSRYDHTGAALTSGTQTINFSGVTLPAFKTVYVYRNGAKLVSPDDFTIDEDDVILSLSDDLPLYDGDVIEVHYIK